MLFWEIFPGVLSVDIVFHFSFLMNQQTLILIFVPNKSGDVEIGLIIFQNMAVFAL